MMRVMQKMMSAFLCTFSFVKSLCMVATLPTSIIAEIVQLRYWNPNGCATKLSQFLKSGKAIRKEPDAQQLVLTALDHSLSGLGHSSKCFGNPRPRSAEQKDEIGSGSASPVPVIFSAMSLHHLGVEALWRCILELGSPEIHRWLEWSFNCLYCFGSALLISKEEAGVGEYDFDTFSCASSRVKANLC